MKILQVLPSLQMGGVERGTIEIAEFLQRRGVANGVVSSGGPMVRRLEAAGVPHHEMPAASKNPLTMLANARRIERLVREQGYDLVHVRSRAPAWSVKWAAARCGVKWISTYHGVYGTKPRLFKIPYNRVMLAGERTVCVSEYVRRHVIENYRADPDRLVRIYRGADVEVFDPARVEAARAAAFRAELGFTPETKLIVMPGRLTRIKGQIEMLEALAMMRHRGVGCLFVGSDQGRTEYSAELKAMAAKLPAGTKVAFLDHSDDMPLVYAAADIVVSASRVPESFGRTIPEAQAMGRLVVGTAHGGACETVEDGKTGFLVPQGDAAALAARLDELLDLPEARAREIAAAAAESARTKFSIRAMCEATLALYRELCGA